MRLKGSAAGNNNTIVFFSDYSFDEALVGITEDNRAVYEYDKMIRFLIENEGFTSDEATEWIECNTIPSLSYLGPGAPIIMHSI